MFKNWILLVAAIFISIGICEAIVRVCYIAPWYEQLIAKQGEVEHRQYRENSLGLRDREFETSKPSTCRRILILGDSFTWGWGVNNEEAVFPKLLETMLNQSIDIPGVQHIEVLNGGVPGSLTDQWLDLLIKTENYFNPDVVVLVFFLRDGTQLTSMGGFFGPIRKDIVSKNRKSILYRHLYLFRLIQDYFDRMSVGESYTQKINQSYFGNKEQTKEWEKAKGNIIKIEQYVSKRSATMGLVVFPILVELNERYLFKAVCNTVMEFAMINHISAHNLLPAFMGQKGEELWISSYDQHPNEKAHRIAAESMLPFIKNLLKKNS